MALRDKTVSFFSGKVASEYDERAKRNAPLIDGMYYTIYLALKDLAPNAQILSVGTGTGNEIFYLAQKFPNWNFTCIEPAKQMAEILQEKIEAAKLKDRISVFNGYVDDFNGKSNFDGALCLLVSHFIIKPKERIAFFISIAANLKPNGILVNADISADMKSAEFEELLPVWLNMQRQSGLNDEMVKEHILAGMGKAYAVSSNRKIERILIRAGLEKCALLYRSIFINAWISKKP